MWKIRLKWSTSSSLILLRIHTLSKMSLTFCYQRWSILFKRQPTKSQQSLRNLSRILSKMTSSINLSFIISTLKIQQEKDFKRWSNQKKVRLSMKVQHNFQNLYLLINATRYQNKWKKSLQRTITELLTSSEPFSKNLNQKKAKTRKKESKEISFFEEVGDGLLVSDFSIIIFQMIWLFFCI